MFCLCPKKFQENIPVNSLTVQDAPVYDFIKDSILYTKNCSKESTLCSTIHNLNKKNSNPANYYLILIC